MAKRQPTAIPDSFDPTLRAHVTNRLAHLALEQDRLREVLSLLDLPAPRSPDWNGKTPLSPSPLVPASGRETLPTPKRRTWSPEAREAQRKRMKAHWRKQKAK